MPDLWQNSHNSENMAEIKDLTEEKNRKKLVTQLSVFIDGQNEPEAARDIKAY
jgi:hypothetical protein